MQFWPMTFLHWIAMGFIFGSLELLLPSFFFMWLGAAAVAVGLIMLAMPDLWWSTQWTLFAVIGVAAFYISRKFMKGKKHEHNASTLNKRGNSMIGEIVIIETAVENGYGKAKVGDTLWSVSGSDMPVGAKAKIIGVDGTVLKVEKA